MNLYIVISCPKYIQPDGPRNMNFVVEESVEKAKARVLDTYNKVITDDIGVELLMANIEVGSVSWPYQLCRDQVLPIRT